MYLSLVNLEGKTLDSFRDEEAARRALRATVEADPTLADEVMVLINNNDGEPAGAVKFEDLASTRVEAPSGYGLVVSSMLGLGATAALGYQIVRWESDVEPVTWTWGRALAHHS